MQRRHKAVVKLAANVVPLVVGSVDVLQKHDRVNLPDDGPLGKKFYETGKRR